MTEYQTIITQTEPMYVAVAFMRTGDTAEIGHVAELYLDWNNTTPQAPENVVLPNKTLSTSHENVSHSSENEL